MARGSSPAERSPERSLSRYSRTVTPSIPTSPAFGSNSPSSSSSLKIVSPRQSGQRKPKSSV